MFLDAPPEGEATARLYHADLDARGYVMNASRLWAWRADVRDGLAGVHERLAAASSLSAREREIVACATSAALGEPYGALASGTRLAAMAGESAAEAILHGRRCDGLSPREAALAAWSRRVACEPAATTRADTLGLRGAGLTDREIFEATALSALAVAVATVNDALGVQPDWQLVATAPRRVRAAVARERAPTPIPGK